MGGLHGFVRFMFKFIKLCFVALCSALVLTSCDKDDEEYFLNPTFQGTVWQITHVSYDGENYVSLPESDIKPVIYFLRKGGFYEGFRRIDGTFVCYVQGNWKQKDSTIYVKLETSDSTPYSQFTLTYRHDEGLGYMHLECADIDVYLKMEMIGRGSPKLFHLPSGKETPYEFLEGIIPNLDNIYPSVNE